MEIPDLTKEQVEFINNKTNLSFIVSPDLSQYTDDQFFEIEDAVSDILQTKGFTPDQNGVNETGAMAESILDYIGEYY